MNLPAGFLLSKNPAGFSLFQHPLRGHPPSQVLAKPRSPAPRVLIARPTGTAPRRHFPVSRGRIRQPHWLTRRTVILELIVELVENDLPAMVIPLLMETNIHHRLGLFRRRQMNAPANQPDILCQRSCHFFSFPWLKHKNQTFPCFCLYITSRQKERKETTIRVVSHNLRSCPLFATKADIGCPKGRILSVAFRVPCRLIGYPRRRPRMNGFRMHSP